MLTLQLTLDNKQITVRVDGQESHTFSLLDLGRTDKEWKDFFKDPRPYGIKLFQALFKDSSAARKVFNVLSKQTDRTIVLVLESSELDSIVWEYAYHDNAYVVEDFAFIRALPEKERPHSNGRLSKGVERLPLLFIPANPLVDLSGEPMRELDIEGEWHEMTQHIVKSNVPFDLIELRPTTPAALQSVMARFQNGMIAHFSGHGVATKDGTFLLFENENGSSNPLEAREFVREIKDQAWIGFLSACQSAVAERTAYGNLARELVKAGVPFALGMQFNLPDPFAPNISGQFYNYLSQGHAVPEAARQARRAVKRENEFYVGMIALYAAHPDEAGKMGWTGSGARTLSTFAAADVSDLPTPSGFIGRQRELMNIGTSLLGKKKPNTGTLHGAGGIGKTALMRQALLHFAPLFEATLAIALDPLPSRESVLGRLERFLNLPSPCSNNTKEREQIVRGKLTGGETLLGLDNFETLIHARDNGSDEEKKTAKSLYAFFKSLAAEGVTLCVTSRENTSLPGETIQEIHGLEDEVGGRLFQNTVSTRKDALNEMGVKKISEAVGGHPLALRLLAPVFEEQAGLTLDGFVKRIETFLPKAHDEWTELSRHESLSACFAFSMENLPKTEEGKNLQIALSRLSVFIAFFADLTAMPVLENYFPESYEEFEKIRPKINNMLHNLWQRGLLERLTLPLKNENLYLYMLHPALRIFAKQRLSDVENAQKNYWESMNNFARMAEEQITKSPLIAQITLRAIPDLLNTVESRNDESVATMQLRVIKLLRHFGLHDDSLRLLGKSHDINESLEDLKYKSAILYETANIYVMHGDLDGAMNLYQQAYELLGEQGNLQGKSAILHEMAGIYFIHGDLDFAMKLHQQSLDIKEGLGDMQGKSVTLHEMAGIYETRGDLDRAIKMYEQSLEISDKLGNMQGISSTLQEIAGIHITLGDLDLAMKLYQQSLEIKEGLGDMQGKAVVIGNIAYVEMKQGNLEKAIDLQKRKLEITKVLGDQKETSVTLHNQADIYVILGDLDWAMKLYQQSLKIKEALGDMKGKSATLHQMAGIYATRGNLDEAMKFYQRSLETKEGLGDLKGKASTLAMLGQLLVAREEYERAIMALVESLQTLLSIGTRAEAQQVAEIITSVRQNIGIEKFDDIWKEITNQSIPDWLSQPL